MATRSVSSLPWASVTGGFELLGLLGDVVERVAGRGDRVDALGDRDDDLRWWASPRSRAAPRRSARCRRRRRSSDGVVVTWAEAGPVARATRARAAVGAARRAKVCVRVRGHGGSFCVVWMVRDVRPDRRDDDQAGCEAVTQRAGGPRLGAAVTTNRPSQGGRRGDRRSRGDERADRRKEQPDPGDDDVDGPGRAAATAAAVSSPTGDVHGEHRRASSAGVCRGGRRARRVRRRRGVRAASQACSSSCTATSSGHGDARRDPAAQHQQAGAEHRGGHQGQPRRRRQRAARPQVAAGQDAEHQDGRGRGAQGDARARHDPDRQHPVIVHRTGQVRASGPHQHPRRSAASGRPAPRPRGARC